MSKQLFIEIAQKYIGTQEQPIGSNCGPLIDRWNTNVNAPIGSYWCASFVSGVALEWESKSGLDWPICLSADCDVWLAVAKKYGILHRSPQAGDLMLLVKTLSNGRQDAFHIGIVEGKDEGTIWKSIEGNSNDDGSRNGYEVAHRSLYGNRKKELVYFIRPWSLLQSGSDWKIVYGDKHIVALLENGRTYAPIRDFVRLVTGSDASLSWEDGPVLDGEPLAVQCILRDGKSYASIRDIARSFNLDFVVNNDHKKVYLQVPST
jgi:hypothetical protein